MRKRQHLSVRERVNAALILLRRDNPRARITVSELCRVAGVSRANIYASHQDVVESLRKEVHAASSHAQPVPMPTVMRKLREELGMVFKTPVNPGWHERGSTGTMAA